MSKIATYNIQNLGKQKFHDKRDDIIKIITSYDIICIQEFRDNSPEGSFLASFILAINNKAPLKKSTAPTCFTKLASGSLLYTPSSLDKFGLVASRPLGTEESTHQERYVVVYRLGVWQYKSSFQVEGAIPGLRQTNFSRPPLCVRFAAVAFPKKQVAVVCIHTKPTAANEELKDLYFVYRWISDIWKPSWRADLAWRLGFGKKRVMLVMLGDFNAGWNYVSRRERLSNDLWMDDELRWLISDDVDTTVGRSDVAYDRIVVTAQHEKYFSGAAVNRLAGLEAGKLSDHFPIHVVVKTK
ncbi:hypothetical protein HK096_002768 [Nowakowskiella sp. JEL0078]|nr:hypothetical protein HK096_002768 [Nowakowskiella sp. JEL0078]